MAEKQGGQGAAHPQRQASQRRRRMAPAKCSSVTTATSLTNVHGADGEDEADDAPKAGLDGKHEHVELGAPFTKLEEADPRQKPADGVQHVGD